MRKRNILIHCLLILMLTVSFVACASTRTQESSGEYVDDFLKSFQIGVETFKGVVQLSGFVNSQNAVDKAVQITKSVKGVKSIKNDLIIK